MAVVTRTSTFSVFSNTLRNVNQVQTELFDLQNQISSGLKTDRFAGLSGQVEQFTFLEARIEKVKAYQQNNSVNISRLETASIAMEQMINLADQMEDLMVVRNNEAQQDDIAFQQQMESKIAAMASELNTRFEGRYIFSGTRTDNPPVIVGPQVPEPLTLGTLDTGYYQGSTENITYRTDDNDDQAFEVRADNEAFQKIFGAAYLALEAHALDDETFLEQGIDMLQDGMEDLIAIEASLNADILSLNEINQRHESLQLYWQGVTEEVSRTDLLGASTKLAVDEAVLQASFSAFSRVNQLRLIDFL